MTQIDLNEIANNPKLGLKLSSSQEEHPKDARVRRFKAISLFIAALLMVLSAFAFCGYVLLSSHFDANDKKWAMTVASGMVSALLGYLIGRQKSDDM